MDNKKNNWKNNWNKWFLKYFDFNQNKTVEWWEYLIPIILIFIIELLAEIVATFISSQYL
jgi:hypothetical protein|tara:strand:- start:325 stop:504 length:180 start_codon:yes stop_codon:yes gene_type:complete